jgi:hypothetical protein
MNPQQKKQNLTEFVKVLFANQNRHTSYGLGTKTGKGGIDKWVKISLDNFPRLR